MRVYCSNCGWNMDVAKLKKVHKSDKLPCPSCGSVIYVSQATSMGYFWLVGGTAAALVGLGLLICFTAILYRMLS